MNSLLYIGVCLPVCGQIPPDCHQAPCGIPWLWLRVQLRVQLDRSVPSFMYTTIVGYCIYMNKVLWLCITAIGNLKHRTVPEYMTILLMELLYACTLDLIVLCFYI